MPGGPIFTVPNQLTLLRMGLAPFLVVLVMSGEFAWALVVFVVAGVTDLLDGMIARRGHQQTSLGAMIDPIADKILLASSFVVLTWGSGLVLRIPAWLTVIALSRDTIIVLTALIINLAVGHRVFHPSWLGKASTLVQILVVGVVLLLNALGSSFPPVVHLFRLALLLTVASAVHYLYLASAGRGSAGEGA